MRSHLLPILALVAISACTADVDSSDDAERLTPASIVIVEVRPSTVEPAGDGEPTTTEPLPPLISLGYREFAVGLDFPVFLTSLPGTDLVVIATKEGRLWLHDGIDVHGEAFLDLRDSVYNDGERGFLGLAFSPDFEQSGRFFVHYSTRDDTILSEFTVDGFVVDPDTEIVVFAIEQPATNHNGGMIEFGPDGYLYMGLGDGGKSNDKFGNGQNGNTVLGAILRFDTSVPGVAAPAGQGFGAPEVWWIGLRNPWRFSIDIGSGLVFIGDVGQGDYEEISVGVLAESGSNFGWPITEGLHCFSPSSGCDVDGLTLPVTEIGHGDGETCSVTGGVVYRGSEIPELAGYYLFSDYCGGYLRGFDIERPVEIEEWTVEVGRLEGVTSFGVDAKGEVYVLSAEGVVYQLIAERG